MTTTEWLIVVCAILLAGLVVATLAQVVREVRSLRGVERRLDLLESRPAFAIGPSVVAVPPSPEPPSTPGPHEHEPFVYRADEVTKEVYDGIGSNGRAAYHTAVVDVLKHHACRICGDVLD